MRTKPPNTLGENYTMATFFGEVLPVTSRALDEDNDDDDYAVQDR